MRCTPALAACFAASLVVPFAAQAATLSNGDRLTVSGGNVVRDSNGSTRDIPVGSWFGVDASGNSQVEGKEKNVLAQGTEGVVVGQIGTPGANHIGKPLPDDSNAVTAPNWFFGNTGSWFFASAPGGSTETGFDMSGWSFGWNGIPRIPLGGLAWQPADCAAFGVCGHTFADGAGLFRWSGVYGDAYTLDFTSTIPNGDPSGLGGVRFYTHFEGRVLPVPEPAPGWLFAAALPLLGIVRLRNGRNRPVSKS